MNRLSQRLKNLSPEQRELLEKQLKKEDIDLLKHRKEFLQLQNIEKKDYYPSSMPQKRLYILHQLEKRSLPYNVPEVLDLKEKIEKERLEKAVRKLIMRQESIRTSFDIVKEEIVQRVHDKVDFDIDYYLIDKSLDNAAAALELDKVIEHFVRPFDLNIAPLLRVGLIEMDEQRYILLLDLHHIITDASSQVVLKKDLISSYKEENLPPLRVSYKDFSEWEHRKYSNTTRITEAREFFETRFCRNYESLNLPYNYFRSNVKTRSSSRYRFVISESLTGRLRQVVIDNSASLFIVLLSVFSLVIAEIANRDDIIIGIPGAARFHEDLKNVVGMFINTLILRTQVHWDWTYGMHLAGMRETIVKVLEYQDFPLEAVYEKQAVKYPDIQVFFNMLNIRDTAKEVLKDFSARHEKKSHISIWDMVFYIDEYANAVEINCNYLNELFNSETIEKIVKLYSATLEKAVNSYDKNVGEFFKTEKRKKLRRN